MTLPALLLADPSPCLRWLALRQVLNLPEDDPEVIELQPLRLADPLVKDLLALQQPDGSWETGALTTGWGRGTRLLSTALALARLGYLGFDHTLPAVQRGADFLLAHQRRDGAWELPGDTIDGNQEDRGYTMIPLQTAFPLRGLAACGYASHPAAERAYEWLLAQRLDDGAWPTGLAAGVHGRVGGYRRLAHSRWGCRSNTTAALICLSHHPQRRTSAEARRGLDLLLGQETRDRQAVGFEVARLLGAEPVRGFFTFFARFDLALLLSLCARIGASAEDARVASLVAYLLDLQGPYGLWDYPARPHLARWVSFDLFRSFSLLEQNGDWVGTEPRTPFQNYPRRPRRF